MNDRNQVIQQIEEATQIIDRDRGTDVRQSRIAAHMSQEELAARSGVRASTISRIERGVIRRPGPRTLMALEKALWITTPR